MDNPENLEIRKVTVPAQLGPGACEIAVSAAGRLSEPFSLVLAARTPVLLKIDVEGFEVNVLRGMERPVPFLSFEVNLPEFRSEGLQCIAKLGSLAENGKFNYAVDCQRGLLLDDWLELRDFTNVFNGCRERAIEVFWKTGATGGESRQK